MLPGDSTILDCVVTSSDPNLVPEIKWRTDDRQPLTYIGDVYRCVLEVIKNVTYVKYKFYLKLLNL